MTKAKTGKHGCSGKTKAGKLCASYPIKGTDRCLSHSDEQIRAKVGFGGPEAGSKGGAAKRVPRLTEVLAAKVEQKADEILQKLFDLVEAEKSVVVGNGPGAHVEVVADGELSLKAIREIYDRFEGRPKQATEISGPNGGAIPTADPLPTDKEWNLAFAEELEKLGFAPALNGHRNGSS